jgi:hypothetical protein
MLNNLPCKRQQRQIEVLQKPENELVTYVHKMFVSFFPSLPLMEAA